MSKEDGAVWGFPDTGVLWWQSNLFERYSDSLDAFLEKYAFGDGCQTLSGVAEDDQWWRLLQRIGRIP
jgi:hypothetical protein